MLGGEPNSRSRRAAIAAAPAAGSAAAILLVFRPPGTAALPIAKTCAPPVVPLPRGSRAPSASEVGAGTPPAAEISSGAPVGAPFTALAGTPLGGPSGAAISTEAAIAVCQSAASTRVTAAGLWPASTDG